MSSEDRTTLTEKTQSDIINLAKRSEEKGFDSVWVGDSVLAKPRHEPLTTLAAIAGETDSVKLGTAVYLPNLRDPVNIAHQTATVDQLSDGRLLLGVGTGSTGKLGSSVKHEFQEMGVPWEKRGDILNEQLEIIRKLWSGEPVNYDGEFYQYENASIGFQPVRDPPVYIGSTVHPTKGVLKSIRERIADYGDGWFPGMAPPEAYSLGLDQIKQTMEGKGRSSSDLNTLYYQDVLIADSEENALEKVREFVEQYYPGLEPTDEELKMRGVFGPPEKVKEQMDKYEEVGVEHLITRFPTANQQQQLKKLAPLVD